MTDVAQVTCLAYTTYPVRANSVIPAVAGVEVYQAAGWTSQLGVAPATP